ncbi:MAG: hypothetical protein ACOYXC_15270, partial [Candidatus Rifleibacteriota bacterium]
MDNFYRQRSPVLIFKKLFLIFFLLYFSGHFCPVSALQQLIAPGQPGNTADWLVDNRVQRANNMTDWAYNAGTGNPAGSFYGRYASRAGNSTADGIFQQTFTTPAGQVNASVYFDRFRFRTGSIDYYRLYASILDSTSAAYPNETGTTYTVDNQTGNYGTTGTWESYGWTTPVLLEANRSYIIRIYMDVRADNTRITGAYIDNLMCNISPANLIGSLNGAANDLTWDASAGAATLDHYNIYRSTTSGGPYGAAIGTSGSNSFSDPTPPAATVVYYVVTDVDDTTLESPISVELPVVRMNVRDGAAADVDSIVGSDVDMNWDDVPAIAKVRYEVALGSSPGASDIVAWTDAALATSYTFSGVSLTNGSTYYTSVRIVTASRTLNSSSSDGFVSINTDVRDGPAGDINFITSLTDVDMNWDALTIPVSSYEVALGTSVGGTEVVGWTNVGLATSYTFSSLALTNGTTYYCSVRAYDMGPALIGVFTSDGFVTANSISTSVRDGSGADVDLWFNAGSFNLNWDAIVGFPVDHFEAALGSTPGGTDILTWVDVGAGTSGSLSGFTLLEGSTYYCSLRTVHALGVVATNTSDGFVFYEFEVRDGTGADEDFSYSPDAVSMNWDSLSIPVLRYEAAVGTTPGGADMVSWTNMGLSTSATFSGLTMVNGTMYYCSVRPVDMGGVPISTVFSDGFQTTILTAITVRDGLKPDINFSFLEDRAESNWDHPVTELIRYEVAVGTTKYGTDVKSWTDVGHARIAQITGLTLASGTRYFSTIRGINAYGQVGAYGGSDGFLAMRDQVLVDTASQTYFHNARVMEMIDFTTDPGSIRPVQMSNAGGVNNYWRYKVQVTVTEPGVTSRINAPCRIQLA